MERKIIELKIDPKNQVEVDFISLVDSPAVEVDFMMFSKVEQMKFSVNEEKRELLGPAMIPDMKIPRLDKDNNVYDVFFSSDTIRQIAQNYMMKGYQMNINVDHSEKTANSYLFQSYIVDKANGIDSPFDVPDGSWIVGVKVTDDETWTKIKSGEWKGFSVEGLFKQFEQFNAIQESDNLNDLLESLRTINSLLQQK